MVSTPSVRTRNPVAVLLDLGVFAAGIVIRVLVAARVVFASHGSPFGRRLGASQSIIFDLRTPRKGGIFPTARVGR